MAGRTFYHLHALGAAGVAPSNPDVGSASPTDRGLRRLVPWLDHVANLGCGGVLLTPIGVAMTHGYDVVDPFRLDQRLGDGADFDAFVVACHDRDLRLILDGVFNHVGRAFPSFSDVVDRGQASEFASWFHIDFAGDDGDGFAYRDFEGHRDLVALNHRSPEVLHWATDVARHWLDRGADGWRLDVAYTVPAEFWKAFTAEVGAHRADALLFGEMIHGDYASFVADSGLHSVTQYELHKALWSACNDHNLFELSWALTRHAAFASVFPPVTFLGNHDVTRVMSQLADPSHIGPAGAVVFTVPGIPCVYYGDELGARGVKEQRPGGDDAVRPTLDALPSADGDDARRLLELYRSLIAFRREHAWLVDASLEVTETGKEHLEYAVRSKDGQALRVTIDLRGDGSWSIT